MNILLRLKENDNKEYSTLFDELEVLVSSIYDVNIEVMRSIDIEHIINRCEGGDTRVDAIYFCSADNTLDIASKLGIRYDGAVFQNVIGLDIDDGHILYERPVFNNAYLSYEKVLDNRFHIVTFDLSNKKELGIWREDIPIEEAKVIVCVGRGFSNEAGLKLAKELAKELNAALGATRAVTDMGILPISKQIGQTGKKVTPNIYIGLGVAGAIQHLSGMRNSDIIIAINKDYRAPIFKYADYGIIGDAYYAVPKLIEKIRNR